MELQCDQPSIGIEHDQHRAGMACGSTKIHAKIGLWLPSRDFLSIRDGLVKDIIGPLDEPSDLENYSN